MELVFGSVYHSTTDPYIGKTQNFAQRSAHWARHGRIVERIPGTENFTKWQDTCLEAFLIFSCGVAKKGGTLNNQINGADPNTPLGRAQLTEGAELADKLGIKDEFGIRMVDDGGEPMTPVRMGRPMVRIPFRLFFP